MKIKKGFFLHRIADACIALQDGSSHIDFTGILNLNPTAAYLWQEIDGQEFDADRVVRILTAHYQVAEETARLDAEIFINSLKEAGVTE